MDHRPCAVVIGEGCPSHLVGVIKRQLNIRMIRCRATEKEQLFSRTFKYHYKTYRPFLNFVENYQTFRDEI